MHDPIRLLAMRGTTLVKNKSLSHTNSAGVGVNDFITTSGLPKASSGGAIGASTGGILFIFMTKKVPIVLRSGSDLAFL